MERERKEDSSEAKELDVADVDVTDRVAADRDDDDDAYERRQALCLAALRVMACVSDGYRAEARACLALCRDASVDDALLRCSDVVSSHPLPGGAPGEYVLVHSNWRNASRLHVATGTSTLARVRALLVAGGERALAHRDAFGRTPELEARHHRRVEVARVLRAAGAPPFAPLGGRLVGLLQGHKDMVACLALLPDGRLASGGFDSSILIWNLPPAAPSAPTPAGAAAAGGAGAGAGSSAGAGAGATGAGATGEPSAQRVSTPPRARGSGAGVTAAAPGGAPPSPVLRAPPALSAPVTRAALALPGGHSDTVRALLVPRRERPTARTLLSAGDDATIREWALGAGARGAGKGAGAAGGAGGAAGGVSPAGVIRVHQGAVYALAALADGRFASGGADKVIRLWARVTPGAGVGGSSWAPDRPPLAGHLLDVFSLAALPGQRLASGGADHAVYLWCCETGARVGSLFGHTGAVQALATLVDGTLASGSHDRTVRLWAPREEAFCGALEGHKGWVDSLAVLPDGRLASGSSDGSVRVWAAALDGTCDVALAGHTIEVSAIAALHDGRLCTASDDRNVRVWA